MDFLYRSKPPTYRGCGQAQPAKPRGFLDGVWCWFFGGLFARSTPSYRTSEGSQTSTASSCGSPPYQAPSQAPPPEPGPDTPPSGGEPTGGDDCGCEPYAEPREIHIYPGG